MAAIIGNPIPADSPVVDPGEVKRTSGVRVLSPPISLSSLGVSVVPVEDMEAAEKRAAGNIQSIYSPPKVGANISQAQPTPPPNAEVVPVNPPTVQLETTPVTGPPWRGVVLVGLAAYLLYRGLK